MAHQSLSRHYLFSVANRTLLHYYNYSVHGFSSILSCIRAIALAVMLMPALLYANGDFTNVELDSTAKAHGIIWGIKFPGDVGKTFFTPDGATLVISSSGSTYFIDPSTLQIKQKLPFLDQAKITADGNTLLGFNPRDSSIVSIDINSKQVTNRFRLDSVNEYCFFDFTPDGQFALATLCTPYTSGGNVPYNIGWVLIDLRNNSVITRKYYVYKNSPWVIADVYNIRFNCFGDVVAGIRKGYRKDNGGTGAIFDLDVHALPSGDSIAHIDNAPLYAFSPDCSTVVTATTTFDSQGKYNRTITLYSYPDKVPFWSFILDLDRYPDLKFSSDGKFLYVANDDIAIYDIESKKQVYRDDLASLSAVALSGKDKSQLVATSGPFVFLIRPPLGTTDVKEIPDGKDILFPNPSNGMLNVKFDAPYEGILSMTIINTNASLLQSLPSQSVSAGYNILTIPTQELASGRYSLRLSLPQGFSKVFSFIVTH